MAQQQQQQQKQQQQQQQQDARKSFRLFATAIYHTRTYESFYVGSPSNLFFIEIDGVETGCRPNLLKYGAPCPPDVIV